MYNLITTIDSGFQNNSKGTETKFNLKDYMLRSKDKFRSKNMSNFLTRLDDIFKAYLLNDDIRRIQVLTININSKYLIDIKVLPRYKVKDFILLRRSLRVKYSVSNKRQRKETAVYLQELATQGTIGKLNVRGVIKEFKTYWLSILESNKLTSSSRSRIFLRGLPQDIRRQINNTLNIDPRNRVIFSNINAIIRKAKRIVIRDENIDKFSLNNNKGPALDKVVRKAVIKREEERI